MSQHSMSSKGPSRFEGGLMENVARAFPDAVRLLTTPPPAVSEAQAASVAKEIYGVVASARLLAGERDRNFMLWAADGWRGVLKFYNSADDAATRDFQHGALLHIERSGHHSDVPRLVKTLAGEHEFRVRVGGASQVGIMISCIPGRGAGEFSSTPMLRRSIGRATAELAVALADYDHACARRVLLWDSMQVGHLRGFADSMPPSERTAWLSGFLDRFADGVHDAARALPQQVIHNDLSTCNVLVHNDRPGTVSGIIDFGDMAHAPTVNDLAITASYFMTGRGDPADELADFLEGYETARPLGEAEIALIPELIQARLATRVLLYQWRAMLFPENRAYILRNSEGAWRLVDRLRDIPPTDLLRSINARRRT
ncbi:phosphotransferase [Marinimicrococcus flavescens]|uniref:Hydroxylysine kinase n=1 Tax=Marinimicrococcus flavescens TaxID=3031815 RepID=A0AAP4D6U1_9PROT|nr:phosphotransferase [Marinimicrococcus flavescens]